MSRGCPEFMLHGGLSRRRHAPGGLGRESPGWRFPRSCGPSKPRAHARSGQAHHPAASVRRAVAPRYLRHEAGRAGRHPRRVQADRHAVSRGLRVSEHLPRFATVIDRFAQVRSVNHRMKNHNSATYYSLTGHAPPIDDIRLRDTQELYPAYGSTVAKLKPVDDPSGAVVRVVSLTSCATAASRPASTRAFWAKRSTRFSSPGTRISRASGFPS